LATIDGRIFLGEGVTASGEDDAVSLGPLAHYAVDEEASAEQEQNDLAEAGFGDGFGAHSEEIARVNRGNHAAAVGDEADLAETMQHIGGKI
jgi:hypothetical protein